MLAMDVVDTLRHQERVVARELASEDRERQLIDKLREIYAAQGIEVPDRILQDGVRALAEDRFVYEPPSGGLQVALARAYVRRGKLFGAVVALVLLGAAAWVGYEFLIRAPLEWRQDRARIELEQEIPQQIAALADSILVEAEVAEAVEQAERLVDQGLAAAANGEAERAREAVRALAALQAQLRETYELRIVSRPGESTGVWRVPDVNPDARNYYIIVEAVNPDGEAIRREITSEETGERETVQKWGVRVPRETYERIARDKSDDGIVQDRVLGVKRPGYLEPEYRMPVEPGAITRW